MIDDWILLYKPSRSTIIAAWRDEETSVVALREKYYKLTMSKNRAEIIWVDRGVSSTSFSWIEVLSMDDSNKFGP